MSATPASVAPPRKKRETPLDHALRLCELGPQQARAEWDGLTPARRAKITDLFPFLLLSAWVTDTVEEALTADWEQPHIDVEQGAHLVRQLSNDWLLATIMFFPQDQVVPEDSSRKANLRSQVLLVLCALLLDESSRGRARRERAETLVSGYPTLAGLLLDPDQLAGRRAKGALRLRWGRGGKPFELALPPPGGLPSGDPLARHLRVYSGERETPLADFAWGYGVGADITTLRVRYLDSGYVRELNDTYLAAMGFAGPDLFAEFFSAVEVLNP